MANFVVVELFDLMPYAYRRAHSCADKKRRKGTAFFRYRQTYPAKCGEIPAKIPFCNAEVAKNRKNIHKREFSIIFVEKGKFRTKNEEKVIKHEQNGGQNIA